MNRSRFALVVLPTVLGMVSIGASLPQYLPRSPYPTYQPAPAASVSAAARVDTVLAGHVFITQLPDSLEGQPIAGYTAKRLPLRSWVFENSFFWSTTLDDAGEHTLELMAHPEPPMDETDPQDEAILWKISLIVL